MPFWTGVFDDKKMLKNCIEAMQEAGLNNLFPLKYSREKASKLNFVSKFVSGYEDTSIWMHMGPLYAQLVKKIDERKAEEHKKQYSELIEKYHNFLEVFDSSGRPFRSPFYYADEGMLWAANYLVL